MKVAVEDEWRSKLSEMEIWYRNALTDIPKTKALLTREYSYYRAFLSSLDGRILDVGGGAGLAAMYLKSKCEYVVIDPANIWSDSSWRKLRKDLRINSPKPMFVQGVGEQLPFQSDLFDGILFFWSLNHAKSVEDCVNELQRVAKSGAKILLVLEDMEPSWHDLLKAVFQKLKSKFIRETNVSYFHNEKIHSSMKKMIKLKLLRSEWPIQDDHFPVREADLKSWLGTTSAITSRDWIGGFLKLEIQKH